MYKQPLRFCVCRVSTVNLRSNPRWLRGKASDSTCAAQSRFHSIKFTLRFIFQMAIVETDNVCSPNFCFGIGRILNNSTIFADAFIGQISHRHFRAQIFPSLAFFFRYAQLRAQARLFPTMFWQRQNPSAPLLPIQ